MSLHVKEELEEPEWDDGLLNVKVEIVMGPEESVDPNQECLVHVPSVKTDPVFNQDPLLSEESQTQGPSLQSYEVAPQPPTCISSKTEDGACSQWRIPHGCVINRTQKRVIKRIEKPKTKHICETCKKEFTRINNLRTHQKTHTRKTPYCKICKREFGRQSNLTTHNKRIHSGDKPYACVVCSKDFKEQYVLNRHMRVHTGEKPYGCEICGRTFAIPNHLKEHKRVHTDDKPFTCDLCSKQFKHKYTLKCHIIHHTGDKPHACDICFKKFIRSTDLKEHLSSHAETKPFSCEMCKAEFSRKDTYYRHVKRRSCRGSGRPLKNRDPIPNRVCNPDPTCMEISGSADPDPDIYIQVRSGLQTLIPNE